MTSSVAIAVLAKAPIPGRVKTRLCPPCTPVQAAAVAGAALEDTLAAVLSVPGARHVLVLEGDPAGWVGRGVEVVPQRGGGLDERLAAAFSDIGGPAVVVGMDTPQVTGRDLAAAIALLVDPTTGAVLGPADDGGFWAIGLRDATDADLLGVPMSDPHTGAAQLDRLRSQGREVRLLPRRRDVDRWVDALAVAEAAPHTRFSAAVTAVARQLGQRGAA